MGPVDLPPEAQEAVDILKKKVQSMPIPYSLILTNLFCLRQVPLRKGWEPCSLRSRGMDATIESPLAATP